VPAVPYATLVGDKIGYIPLQTFNENTAEEVEAAATKLVSQGAKGIVLDLRDNGGGIVEQALAGQLACSSRTGQPIVNVRGRNTPDETARASSDHLSSQPPLIILTDGNSASASEIVAGALQDHDRALVLGTTSFGKGLVQSLFPLDGGYALKITRASGSRRVGAASIASGSCLPTDDSSRRSPTRSRLKRRRRRSRRSSPTQAASCTAVAASRPTSSFPTTRSRRPSRSSIARWRRRRRPSSPR
jgi:carboxyl-terminal processing protease